MKLIRVEVEHVVIADGFRWVKPAASLKQLPPVPDRSVRRASCSFPLGKTGGLIEARLIGQGDRVGGRSSRVSAG